MEFSKFFYLFRNVLKFEINFNKIPRTAIFHYDFNGGWIRVVAIQLFDGAMGRVILFVIAVFSLFGEEHTFRGKHFLASYLDCDLRAISDLDGLIHAMDDAVRASGATILDKTPYIFPPNGLTIVYLLSESHASLHTYPEYGKCFVDLFTCGDSCSAEKFDELMRAYLQPGVVNARLFLRGEDVQEVPFPR